MQAQKAEGTRDLMGREMRAWQRMQRIAAEVFEPYGFDPIETPAIEQLDVFVHGIGQSTDVVRKEMFRVFSGANLERALAEGTDAGLKPKQRLALRPEGTAGVVRSVVENNLVPQGGSPVKLYYAEAMFRGERPQKGRLRQFHQVGIEWLGAPDPAADAECIIMLMELYRRMGFDLSKLRLLINSMGDPACRPAYRDRVRSFILDHADEMCDECRERAELNPLRAFDCKNDHCREVMQARAAHARRAVRRVPRPLRPGQALPRRGGHRLRGGSRRSCAASTTTRARSSRSRRRAPAWAPSAAAGATTASSSSRAAEPTPGVGFAVGFERALLALEAFGVAPGRRGRPLSIYVANAGDETARRRCSRSPTSCGAAGIRTEANYQGRSLKSQFKQADKLGCALIAVVGGDELAQGAVRLRDMTTHDEALVPRDEVVAAVRSRLLGA